MNLEKTIFIIALISMNAVPLFGVLFWQWQSFDLIFLYWLENIIIGIFTLIRFIIRPYAHPVEAIFPLFFAPFFAIHYGMFCYAHGSFLIHMFGKDILGDLVNMGIVDLILPIIEQRYLIWAVAALFLYQLIDWIRDNHLHGLGSDGIKDLMTAPYRRIIVLHITIIGTGFLLSVLQEPVAGLVLMIVLKTGFDIYNWQKDENRLSKNKPVVLNDKIKKKIDELIDNPTVIVNGKTIQYDNFNELKASKHYQLLQVIFRLTGKNSQLKIMDEHVEQRLNEKSKSEKKADQQ